MTPAAVDGKALTVRQQMEMQNMGQTMDGGQVQGGPQAQMPGQEDVGAQAGQSPFEPSPTQQPMQQ